MSARWLRRRGRPSAARWSAVRAAWENKGRLGAGGSEPAEDVLRRFGFGQGAEQAARGEPVGQSGGELEQDLGAADEEQRQIGRSVGREVEQEPQGLERRDRVDQVGVIDDEQRAFAARRPGGQMVAQLAQRVGQRARRGRQAAELFSEVRHQLGRGERREGDVDRRPPSSLASRRASRVLPEPGGPKSTAGPWPCSSA